MIIAITGQFRSGTSAMAEVVHNLGYPVAHTIFPGAPPTWRPEWEDTELSTTLARGDFDPQWLHDHMLLRGRMAQMLFKTATFAIKSPYLALNQYELQAVAAALGERMSWVVMQRPQREIDESRSPYPWISDEVAQSVKDALPSGPDVLTVQYHDLVNTPMTVIDNFLDWSGLTSDRKREARAAVLQPLTTF